MPLMPAPERHPQPAARAQARLAFDALLARRVSILTAGVAGLDDEDTRKRDAEDARLLDSLGSAFADAVDRENSTRGILRTGTPVDYVDAVVLTGTAGLLVVDAPDYDAAPVYWQIKAGSPDLIVHGADLDAYLRTGDTAYAERVGLA